MNRIYKTPAEAALRDADVLLYRASWFSPVSAAIGVYGAGHYSHAAMIRLWEWEPFVCEFREWIGGRCTPLAGHVAAYSGGIDVYRPADLNLEQCRAVAARMAHETGRRYNYAGVLMAGLLHQPIVRWLPPVRKILDRTEDLQNPTLPWFCSQGVAASVELATGRDPVPGLPPGLCEPVHLERTDFWAYYGTLVKNEGEKLAAQCRDRLRKHREDAAANGPTIVQFNAEASRLRGSFPRVFRGAQ